MAVALSALLAEIPEVTRAGSVGTLDNTKRTRAISRVLQDLQDFADWDKTRRTKEFAFIDGVNEYSLENYVGTTCQDNDGTTSISDFKNPYDIRLVNRAHTPFAYRDAKEVRYRIQQGRRLNEYGIDGDLLIINYARQTSSLVHNCDSLTANGTVSASGDASNLTIDEVIFDEGSGALNFDVSAGTSLVVTFDGFDALNLETFQNKSHWTAKIWLPTITNFTSVKLEWGDDASNNWSKTETAPAGVKMLQTGKNLFAFSWEDATENGSPSADSVNWARITITYSAGTTDTDFRIDDLRVGQSVKMDLDYYSLAMVKDSAGDFQLEFNPAVTQTDELLIPEMRRTVVEGAKHELFEIIGGKSERDRTDSFTKYENMKKQLKARMGRTLRRPMKTFSFPGRRGRMNETIAEF